MFKRILKFGIEVNKLNLTRVNYARPILTSQFRYDYEQRYNYKNFGHKEEKESKITKWWCAFLTLAFILPSIDYKWYVC